ncbi:MAG: hypothetical protein Q9M92_17865 [Enterobacterales bacterium]|nr:hypothetical protein [Enterobacterales bacterium]
MKAFNQWFFTLLLLIISISTQAAIEIASVYPSRLTLTQKQSFQINIDGRSLNDIARAFIVLKAKDEQKPVRLSLKVEASSYRATIDLTINQVLPTGNYLLYLLDRKNNKVKVPLAIRLQNSKSRASRTSGKKPSVNKPSSKISAAKSKRSAREKSSRTKVKQRRQANKTLAQKGTSQTSAKQNYKKTLGQITKPVARSNNLKGQSRNNQNTTPRVMPQSDASRVQINPSLQSNPLGRLNTPSTQRISIMSVSINGGAQNTDDRLLAIRVETSNGSIKGYRICDINEGPTRQDCDVTQKPWQTYQGQSISYLLESDNLATNNGNNEPRKRLLIQVKGYPLPSNQLNNVMVDNFSTIAVANISYQGQPVLESYPSAVPQYHLMPYEFSISNLRAFRVTGEVKKYSQNCNFKTLDQSTVYNGERQADKQFRFRIYTMGEGTMGALSCNAMLFINVFDKNNQEIERHRLSYVQQFLAYESRRITVENTATLFQKLAIEKDTMFLSDQGYTLCGGQSIGTSGRQSIGLVIEDGDIVFSTRSTNLGRTCAYTMKPRIKKGWMLSMNFEQVKDGDKCEVSRTGTPNHIAPVKIALTRDRRFVGWETVFNMFNGTRETGFRRLTPQTNTEIPIVFLTCKPALSNNHEVKSILKSVIFEVPPTAPEDATWQDAFL